MKIIMFNDKQTVNHEMCASCPKNNVVCNDNDEVCIAVEMWVQFVKEESIIEKLQMIDNVRELLDLKK